ncbi:MAG: hypothetical protein IKH11_05450 [Bacteroidales bacterium]|nr:hypothetical protein [Bacteroidales bacterium]
MKRTIIILATLGLTLSAWAQDTYYAEMLSRNNYYGTARSVGLGNAVTALGGDLGTIGINPAGAAVNSFSQFTLTPALLIQNTGAGWSADGSANYSSPHNTSHVKPNLPNCGLNLVFYTGELEGLKYFTAGFVVNTVNTFLNYTTAYGTNDKTSFLGNLAAWAGGLKPSEFGNDLYSAYAANQFGEFGREGSLMYSGANQMIDPTDNYAYVPGTLNQTSYNNTYGTKSDVLLNLGFNVSDKVYFGFNLGLPSTRYRREDGFLEKAENMESFPVNFVDKDGNHLGREGEPTTYYTSSENVFKLNTEANGVYAKAGVIVLPVEGLRIGAAFQTPTHMVVSEEWQYSAKTKYNDRKFNGSSTSARSSNSYSLRTPYVVDAGIAWTFGAGGLVSVDYELTDYSVMKYGEENSDIFNSGAWDFTNECNRLFCGVSHSVRAGLEFKPIPELALRGGYSIITDPERYALDDSGNMITADNWEGPGEPLSNFKYFVNNTHAFSLGIGYASRGSFFADAAVRLTKYPSTYLKPYYFGEYWVVDKNDNPIDIAMPEIKLDRKVVDVLLTIGWRF